MIVLSVVAVVLGLGAVVAVVVIAGGAGWFLLGESTDGPAGAGPSATRTHFPDDLTDVPDAADLLRDDEVGSYVPGTVEKQPKNIEDRSDYRVTFCSWATSDEDISAGKPSGLLMIQVSEWQGFEGRSGVVRATEQMAEENGSAVEVRGADEAKVRIVESAVKVYVRHQNVVVSIDLTRTDMTEVDETQQHATRLAVFVVDRLREG